MGSVLFPTGGRHRRPETLAHRLRRALIAPVGFVAGYAVLAGVVTGGTFVPSMEVRAVPDRNGVAAVVADSGAGRVMARHECWSGHAPDWMEGRAPGHVVVTRPGRPGPVYAGASDVESALGHVFDAEVPGLVVHGFCP